MTRTLLIYSTGVALLVGCGSSAAVPNERVASTEAAIRAAREVGAQQTPQAALHLRLAEEQLDTGRKLMKEGDNKRASWVLARAESDAEVAVAMARETGARAVAQQTLERVKQLRSQMPQQTGGT